MRHADQGAARLRNAVVERHRNVCGHGDVAAIAQPRGENGANRQGRAIHLEGCGA